MPCILELLVDQPVGRDTQVIEEVQLHMLSTLNQSMRVEGCHKGLVSIEAALREAQCLNALDSLHSVACCKRDAFRFRDQYI